MGKLSFLDIPRVVSPFPGDILREMQSEISKVMMNHVPELRSNEGSLDPQAHIDSATETISSFVFGIMSNIYKLGLEKVKKEAETILEYLLGNFNNTCYREILKFPDQVAYVKKVLISMTKTTQGIVFLLAFNELEKHENSASHCFRVALLVAEIGEKMKWTPEQKEIGVLSALGHDIMKSLIPSNILSKREDLNNGERAIMDLHSFFSAYFFQTISKVIKDYKLEKKEGVVFDVIKIIAGNHHPSRYLTTDKHKDRISFESELKEAKNFLPIVILADVFVALTEEGRGYKKPFSAQEVFEVLSKEEKAGYISKDSLEAFFSTQSGIDFYQQYLEEAKLESI